MATKTRSKVPARRGKAGAKPKPQNRRKTGVSRDASGRWVQGISGNPGGRPTKQPLTEAIRKELADGVKPAAVAKKLIGLAVKGNVQAIKVLLDRSDGKVPQAITVEGLAGSGEWLQVKALIVAVLESNPKLLADFTHKVDELLAKEDEGGEE